jgi:hypothetical protein
MLTLRSASSGRQIFGYEIEAGAMDRMNWLYYCGKSTQIDPLNPNETDPPFPFQIDPLFPAEIDPLKNG